MLRIGINMSAKLQIVLTVSRREIACRGKLIFLRFTPQVVLPSRTHILTANLINSALLLASHFMVTS
jgi:hypothetical protein